jgi:hypothetical protein
MPYVGVLLQIKDMVLRSIFRGKYLLQVWKKGGEKIFQKILNSEISAWTCYDDILIFRTPEGNEFDDCITIVDLKDPLNRRIYIKDFSTKFKQSSEPFDYFFY